MPASIGHSLLTSNRNTDKTRNQAKPVLPFARIGGDPNQNEGVGREPDWKIPRDEEHAGGMVRQCQLAEVLGHRLKIVRIQDAAY